MSTQIMRQHIIQTTVDLLRQRTVKKLTVQTVLEISGICRSSFYRIFPDGIAQLLEVMIIEILATKFPKTTKWSVALQVLKARMTAEWQLFCNMYRLYEIVGQHELLRPFFHKFVLTYLTEPSIQYFLPDFSKFMADSLCFQVHAWLHDRVSFDSEWNKRWLIYQNLPKLQPLMK